MPEIQKQQEFIAQSGNQQLIDQHPGGRVEVFDKEIGEDGHEKKGFIEKIYEKVTGKDKDEDYQLQKDAKKCDKKAQELTKEGHKILDHTEKDVKKAEKLQAKAAEMAEKANKATEHALNEQIEGQNKLATAGYKKMQAGAKLQAQANNSHTCEQVPYNDHLVQDVRQQTSTTGGAQVIGHQQEHIVREYGVGGKHH